jgi:Fe-Mn family superoxide dismutase
MRGIGWAVLYKDTTDDDRLINFWINEHDEGHPAGGVPILNTTVTMEAKLVA